MIKRITANFCYQLKHKNILILIKDVNNQQNQQPLLQYIDQVKSFDIKSSKQIQKYFNEIELSEKNRPFIQNFLQQINSKIHQNFGILELHHVQYLLNGDPEIFNYFSNDIQYLLKIQEIEQVVEFLQSIENHQFGLIKQFKKDIQKRISQLVQDETNFDLMLQLCNEFNRIFGESNINYIEKILRNQQEQLEFEYDGDKKINLNCQQIKYILEQNINPFLINMIIQSENLLDLENELLFKIYTMSLDYQQDIDEQNQINLLNHLKNQELNTIQRFLILKDNFENVKNNLQDIDDIYLIKIFYTMIDLEIIDEEFSQKLYEKLKYQKVDTDFYYRFALYSKMNLKIVVHDLQELINATQVDLEIKDIFNIYRILKLDNQNESLFILNQTRNFVGADAAQTLQNKSIFDAVYLIKLIFQFKVAQIDKLVLNGQEIINNTQLLKLLDLIEYDKQTLLILQKYLNFIFQNNDITLKQIEQSIDKLSFIKQFYIILQSNNQNGKFQTNLREIFKSFEESILTLIVKDYNQDKIKNPFIQDDPKWKQEIVEINYNQVHELNEIATILQKFIEFNIGSKQFYNYVLDFFRKQNIEDLHLKCQLLQIFADINQKIEFEIPYDILDQNQSLQVAWYLLVHQEYDEIPQLIKKINLTNINQNQIYRLQFIYSLLDLESDKSHFKQIFQQNQKLLDTNFQIKFKQYLDKFGYEYLENDIYVDDLFLMDYKLPSQTYIKIYDRNQYLSLQQNEIAYGILLKRYIKQKGIKVLYFMHNDWVQQNKKYKLNNYFKQRMKGQKINPAFIKKKYY